MRMRSIGVGALALLAAACAAQPEERNWAAESKAMFGWVEQHAATSLVAHNIMRDKADQVGYYLIPFDAFEGLPPPDFSDPAIEYPRNAVNMFNGEETEVLGSFTVADIDKAYVGVTRVPATCRAQAGGEDAEAPQPEATDAPKEPECEAASVLFLAHLAGDPPSRFYVVPKQDFSVLGEKRDLPLLMGGDPMALCGFAAERGAGNGSLEDDAIGICKGRLRAAAAIEHGLTLELDAVTQGGLEQLARALNDSAFAYPEERAKGTFVWDFSKTEVKGTGQ